MDNEVLFPGSTIGIIGNSPNGIMLVKAAKKMGFRVVAYGAEEAAPTMQEADLRIIGQQDDKGKLQDFAERCDIVTYESENISAEVIAFLERFTRVPQGKEALENAQDRLLERAFLEQININIAPYATIVGLDDVYQSIGSIGYPCVLKPIQKGYGRRRQQIIRKQSDISKCADLVDLGTFILEAWIPYEKELSVIIAKEANGDLNMFPIVENIYHEHQLYQSIVKAEVSSEIKAEVQRLASDISNELNYVGILEIAFFLTKNGTLYVKRIVPAPHKAGYVFDKATNVSMFEQHLRALTHMPLPQVKLLQPTVAVSLCVEDMNRLRTQWVLKDNWYYHFYRYPKTAHTRESGYIVVLADTVAAALQQIDATGICKEPVESEKQEQEESNGEVIKKEEN
ncbi:5-(carboxyamino)imidazole ribonucleotide synthase [Liquorilactobacillus capillatus]|uniref:Phosphoribosylaminoimidazole carboxylase, ATPase subunit n=1 Tax=Liquorilactobacillus capillatus DSM 19910 TaxID=1423731 RepID=A0A0R1LXX5_9LACO|nr:ATP-grasp domain-containing protein [Liquorilactobacillus capillatus]KRL00289.1 phosphoribosylaminoimidazole carboxylase, ATPase subunit [Liquorilactobacillus capillatus DSM 19910]